MAKQKDKNNEDEVTFMGHAVDPDIQKKVDEYMKVDSEDLPSDSLEDAETSSSKSSKIEIKMDDPEADIATAPLLPIDELPSSVASQNVAEDVVPEPKVNKIEVIHHIDDEPVLESEPEAEPEHEEIVDEPEDQVTEPELEELNPEEDSEQLPEEPTKEESTDEDIEPDEPLNSEMIDMDSEIEPETESIEAENEVDESIDGSKTVGELADDVDITQDPGLEKAIDEIIAVDTNKILDVEDKELGSTAPERTRPANAIKPVGPRENWFKVWWTTPLYRNLTITGIIGILVAIGLLPMTRYPILNLSGVRVSASVKVLDDKTSLPLKNVEVIDGGQTAKTDSEGNAKLSKLKLGKQEIIIKKVAFADTKKTVTLGWGSNPLGEMRIAPTGSQFTFNAKDFLSDKPIANAEVSYQESSAKFNANGQAVLTMPIKADNQSIEVSVTAQNYREEKVKISTSSKESVNVKLVPSKKHVFVSKRSGKFDLYAGDYDGKNEKVILAGSGIEKEASLALAVNPSTPVVAFVSTRENVRNSDGFILSTLNIVNTDSGEVTKVTQSERIQLVDWSGTKLVYVKIAQGASQANPNRYKLMSYDTSNSTGEKELASTNYFNDVLSVNGVIYYTPAIYQVNGKVGLFKINADGSGKKTVFEQEVWNLFRTSYDKVSMSVGQDWYELNLSNDEIKKVGGAPATLKSRVYISSSSSKQSLWIDDRDGKSVLLNYDQSSKVDKALVTSNGIKNPVIWLDNDHIVYRVASSNETADYILSLSGGQPRKVGDVTNTVGVDRWYYY